MRYNKIKFYIDLCIYLVIIPLVLMLVPICRWMVDYPFFAVSLVIYLYALYYSIRKIRVPQLFMNHQYWKIAVFLLIFLVITYLLARFPYPNEKMKFGYDFSGEKERIRYMTVWFMSLVVMGNGLVMSLVLELLKQIIQKKELEDKKKEAELALYKAQINPHFFFNTMNTLYGLVISKSDKAEDAFIRFTSLLKYSYSQIKKDLIPIKEELDYINNYISLQKLRLNRFTTVDFTSDIDNNMVEIPPMLLISFVENAFKYGTSSSHNCEIVISIRLHENILDFECSNFKMSNVSPREKTAVGIDNAIERLNILYPQKYSFEVKETEMEYKIKLKIQLQ